jgi:hypothetical protein
MLKPSADYATNPPAGSRADSNVWSRSWPLLILGMVGSLVLFSTIEVPSEIRAAIGGSELRVRSQLWAMNTALLVLGVLLGAGFAHRAGLLSLIAHRLGDRKHRMRSLPLYACGGFIVSLLLFALDQWLTNTLPDVRPFIDANPTALLPLEWRWPSRVLYGGFTSEIMWRWGVMSFVTSLSLRGFQRRCALTVSVALSALLFALDRLPLLYQSVPDVPVGMAIRVVVLNTISGVAAGCAYARHSLEAAMTVHAAISAIDVGVAIG